MQTLVAKVAALKQLRASKSSTARGIDTKKINKLEKEINALKA
jgi:hypothetical protein